MWRLLVRTLLALNSSTTPRGEQALLRRAPRIVGGTAAKIAEIPYVVNIRRNGVFECGGSLLTPSCVLTAAHCVKESAPHAFVVRGGVSTLDDIRNGRKVDNIFIHTEYNRKDLNFDLAVFQLRAPLNAASVQTIQLSDVGPQAGDVVQVSGWGLTRENGTNPANRLRTAKLQVLPQSKCRQLYADYRNVTETMFCASVPGKRDACAADSGGPAVLKGRLVGIVSWGKAKECGRSASPGVYVNVQAVRPWIERIVKKYCLTLNER